MLHREWTFCFVSSISSFLFSLCIFRSWVVGSRTLGGDKVALGGDIQVGTLMGIARVALVGIARVV